MFLGHYAVALGAKKLARNTSLGTLFAAATFLDLIWPVFVIAGLEAVNIEVGATDFTPLDFSHYPYSHSLLASTAWGGLFASVYYFVTRRKRPDAAIAAITLGVLVVSHWVLDAFAHRPDLPLTPWGSERIGLALWNSVPGTLIVEVLLFAMGLWLYITSVKPLSRRRATALAGLITLFLIVYFAAAFGPLPPSGTAIAWSALGQWLFVICAAWVDHRPRDVDALSLRQGVNERHVVQGR